VNTSIQITQNRKFTFVVYYEKTLSQTFAGQEQETINEEVEEERRSGRSRSRSEISQ